MLLIDPQGATKGKGSSLDLIPHIPPELAVQRRLEAGDVAFFGHGPDGQFTMPIGIEYKKVTEALDCFISKRFVGEQYPKMSNLYQRIYFLIEGEYAEGSDGTLVVPSWRDGKRKWVSHGWRTTYRQFDNWQNSLAETGKVRFKFAKTPAESAAQVLDLYYMWTKEYDSHKSLFSFDKSQLPPLIAHPSTKRLVAAVLPGLGWELSARTEQHFTSIRAMANAEEEEWTSIPGIGKKKATKIVSALRGET